MPPCPGCGEVPREFPEDREVRLCRCDTTAQEWRAGHLVTDARVLFGLMEREQ